MTKPYPEFDDSDNNEDDDEIGALSSILSWDENEGGGGGEGINVVTKEASLQPSALPDLVTFNQDGGLHQVAGNGGGDLSIPMPSQINFNQAHPVATVQDRQSKQPDTRQQFTMNQVLNTSAAPHQAQHHQQQQQAQYQHQLQLQANQQSVQQTVGGNTSGGTQQQSQMSQQAVGQNMGAFPFFQQNALLAQQQSSQSMPTMMMLAQLQQQFNAFQQVAPGQQHVAAATATAPPVALQQHVPYQAQAQMSPVAQVAARHAPVPTIANSVPAPPKKGRPAAKKPPVPKPAQTKVSSVTSKASVVSATDTDGELSSKADSNSLKKKLSASPATTTVATPKTSEIDTSNMTPAEKAKANRDRNREHARNTRLRKKAYLEKLKSSVDELCRERDNLVSERAGAASILVDMHNTRTEVLMSFFALRSANEKRRELWASILDESCFSCVLPVTPYRSFPASEVQVSKCQRTILGIDSMMSDTASLHVLLNSLVDRSRYPNATIMFRYTLVTEEAVVAGNQMMARWVMSTLNATQCGARMEVTKHGMLCCKFNSAHKIVGLELTFDVMSLMLQLKQAAGAETFSVIPNTVQTCQRSFDKPMVIALAEEPHTIVQVNKLWEDLTGYKAEDVVGKVSSRILEGEKTDSAAVEVLLNEIRYKRPASAVLLNYKKSGELFRNFFLVYPLSTDSRITHYLYLTSHIDTTVSGKGASDLAVTVGQNNPQAAPMVHGLVPTGAPPQQAYYNGIQNSRQLSMVHTATQPLLGVNTVISNVCPTTVQGAALQQGHTVTAPQPQAVSVSKRPLAESATGTFSPKAKMAKGPADKNR